jgi:hypothetical protein
MDPEKASEFAQTDPELSAEEKEFTIGCTKKEEEARLHTNISSQIRRALTHSHIDVDEISVYNKDDGVVRQMSVEDFDGGGIIVGLQAHLPMEMIKIRSTPRSSRSYANIISTQHGVNIEE